MSSTLRGVGILPGRAPAGRPGKREVETAERLRWGQVAPLFALGGALAVLLLVYVARVFPHPGEWLYYEGADLFHAERLGHGEALYRSVSTVGELHFPIYPPGFYAVWAPFTWFTGALWPGRLISLLAMMFTAGAVYRIARRLGAGAPAAGVGAVSLLTFPWMILLASSARPDALALAFAAGALWTITRWEDDGAQKDLVAAALLCVAMVFTKHNLAPLVLMIGVAVAIRDRRAAGRFAAILGAVSVALLMLVQLATGAFVQTMVKFGGGMAWEPLRGTLTEVFARPHPHPALVLAVLPILVARARPRAVHLAWFAGMLTLLTAAKVGSSMNYGALLFLASALLLPLALEWVRVRSTLLGVALPAAIAVLLVSPTIDEVDARRDDLAVIDAATAADEAALAGIEAHPGRVLGDRDDLLLRSGRVPEFEPYVYAQLELAGDWDPVGLRADIEAQRFALVQTSFDLDRPMVMTSGGVPRWPSSTVRAIRSAYCPLLSSTARPTVAAAPGIWLYEPC